MLTQSHTEPLLQAARAKITQGLQKLLRCKLLDFKIGRFFCSGVVWSKPKAQIFFI